MYSIISWFDELESSASAYFLGLKLGAGLPGTSFVVGRRPIAGSGKG